VRFLVDNQLPGRLAEWLRDQGHESEHLLEIGLAQSKDNIVWKHALSQRAVIITKDEDYAEWIRRGRPGPQIVWIRLGNATSKELIHWIAPIFPLALRQLELGARLVELR
jgi:predicted nuclease of predicted toxin-antitoxin system